MSGHAELSETMGGTTALIGENCPGREAGPQGAVSGAATSAQRGAPSGSVLAPTTLRELYAVPAWFCEVAPASSPTQWGGIPVEARTAWANALRDFPPSWPGFGALAEITLIIESGVPQIPQEWADLAQEFYSRGFSPTEYYLLRVCVQPRLGQLSRRVDGRFVSAVETGAIAAPPIFRLIAADWELWLVLLAQGHSGLRALDYTLSQSEAGPAVTQPCPALHPRQP